MQTVPRLIKQFAPHHYSLSIDIDRTKRTFHGVMTVEGYVQKNTKKISLHSANLAIKSVTYNDMPANFVDSGEFDELVITHDEISEGSATLSVTYSGTLTDTMHGMYPCHFVHDNISKELIATQFESHHAREVFPCIDEPEAKATFDVTLSTEVGVTVLGNMPISDQHVENDKLVTQFETSPRMSTYLVAWVYGELQRKTARTKDGVEVSVWATPAQSSASLDFALDHAVKSIEFFDEYFGIPYPLPKSDHVALPDFSSGAMENWGLITYRETALLADPQTTTIASKQYIATVISHELSHQWFGNLVTMRWWNNLWLNESFATLMEYVAVDAIHPEWNAWLDFAANESILALRRDAMDGVQSVQVDVNHPDEIASLFDGAIVYAKGARLMRMCQAYIGHAAFQQGLQSYFTEFAYRNTEADDLWAHLSAASGKDISELMNTWISQSGYPVITLSDSTVSQERFFIGPHQPSSQLWPIPLGSDSPEDMPSLLETRTLRMPIANDERLNVGDTAHFITHYSDDHLERILSSNALSELDRLQLLHEQTLLVRGGRKASVKLIDLLEHYRAESSEHVWDIISLAIAELKKFVEDDDVAEQKLRAFAGSLASVQYQRLGWTVHANESEEDTKLRSTILSLMVYSQDANVLKQVDDIYLSGINAINPEIRSLVLSSVIHRTPSIEIVEELLKLHHGTSSADLQQDIAAGLTSARDAKQIELLLAQFTIDKAIRHQDLFRWFVYLIRNRYSRDASWKWMRSHWTWIEQTYGGDKSYSDFPRYAASGLCSRNQREEYEVFFRPLSDQAALRRTIELGLVEIDARIELLERDGDAVRRRLRDL